MSIATKNLIIVRRESLPLSTPYVAPSGACEVAIAQIFAEVFGLDQVGSDDEFFDLGGDSLLAEVLSMRVSESTGRDFPPSSLFEYNSPKLIAKWLETRLEKQTVSSQPYLQPRIEAKIRALIAGWRGVRDSSKALVIGHNPTGSERPLFWCLQEGDELNVLASQLGSERPLYGMSSGHLAMEPTRSNIGALARRYVDEILEIQPKGPYLIGGNCRGGMVAAEIARQLWQAGLDVPLLTLIDVLPHEAFQTAGAAGKVAFFYGIYSRFNPYRRFRSPELGWRKRFPQGVRVDLLAADHGQYFSEGVLPSLVAKWRSALEWVAESTAIPSDDRGEWFPDTAYRARLRTCDNLTLRCGEARTIQIEVKNQSPIVWPASIESGIALGSHWLTRRGEVLVWGDGRTPLQRPVLPSASTKLNLQVRAPAEPGEYLLEVDLVEEGVAWFKERRSHAAIVPTTVLHRVKRSSQFAQF